MAHGLKGICLLLGVVSLGAASSVSAVWEVSCSQAIGAGLGTAQREGIVSHLEVPCPGGAELPPGHLSEC